MDLLGGKDVEGDEAEDLDEWVRSHHDRWKKAVEVANAATEGASKRRKRAYDHSSQGGPDQTR